MKRFVKEEKLYKDAIMYIRNNFHINISPNKLRVLLMSDYPYDDSFLGSIQSRILREQIALNLKRYEEYKILGEKVLNMFINSDFALIHLFLVFFLRYNLNKINRFLSESEWFDYYFVRKGRRHRSSKIISGSWSSKYRYDIYFVSFLNEVVELVRPHFITEHRGVRLRFLDFHINNMMFMDASQYINSNIRFEILYYVSESEMASHSPYELFYILASHNILVACSFIIHISRSFGNLIEKRVSHEYEENLYDDDNITNDEELPF